MTLAVIALVAGVALLTVCADVAVTSAERLAEHLGVSAVIVGALVIGLGTSLPEMVVSGIAAAQRDTIDLAIGNVIGSNVANLTLALGICTMVAVVHGQHSIMLREGVLMVAASGLFMGFVYNDHLARWEALILLAGMGGAAWILAGGAKDGSDRLTVLRAGEVRRTIVLTLGGLVGVVIGAQFMVSGAVDIAEELGASEAFIGLTIVAFGTSLPEIATAVASARRGSVELVIGNVLGSNIFNSLAVAGLAGLLGDGVIEESTTGTLWVMMTVSLLVVIWGVTRHSFGRRVGIVLVLAYGALVVLGL